MNKVAKALLITAVCGLLGGIILLTTCVAIAHSRDYVFTLDGRGYGTAENRSYDNTGAQSVTLDSLNSLQLDLVGEPVTIRYGGDEITLEWSQTYDQQYMLTNSGGGHVRLQRDEMLAYSGLLATRGGVRFELGGLIALLNGSWWDAVSQEAGTDRPVTLTLPEGTYLGDLDIHCASSRVTIEDLSARHVTIDAAEARLTMTGGQLEQLTMNNAAGMAELTDITIERIDMQTASGHLTLHGGHAERIDINGLDAHLNIDGTQGLNRVTMEGLNLMATLRLPGSANDYRFEVEGLNATLRVNGQSYWGGNSIGSGSASIKASGLNAAVDVTFGD